MESPGRGSLPPGRFVVDKGIIGIAPAESVHIFVYFSIPQGCRPATAQM